MLFRLLVTVLVVVVSRGSATFINIPGCESLYQFDFSSMTENDTLPFCYCDNATSTSLDLVQINCIFGSTLSDLSNAIGKVRDAQKTVSKISLEKIYIDPDSGIPADYFQSLNVTPNEISIQSCRTPNIIKDHSFRGLENSLTSLAISQCILTSVPSDVRQLVNLQNLELSYDNFATIQKDDLSQLTKLKYLVLNDNGLNFVEHRSFRDLKSLEELTLGPGNSLNASILNEVSDLVNLRYLNFRANQIDVPDEAVFKKLTKLTGLHLEANVIGSIKSKTLQGLTNLRYLNLFENLLKTIDAKTFANLPSLEYLSLNSNFLTEIRADMFQSESLTTLKLIFNDIRKLKADSFKLTPSLMDLDLRANGQMTYIDSNAFNGLVNLQRLNLSYVNISSFSGDVLKPTPNLTDLDLSNTPISSLDKNVFDNVKTLTVLRFTDTLIQTLPNGIFDKLENLALLDVYNNKWVCDKSLGWFVKWLKSNVNAIEMNGVPQCASPSDLAGVNLFDVDVDKLH